ncbi:hypothetical protein B0A55_07779 [Friedmanniomyces simplex]|uniref:Cercosporin MFS transporter CTB4 n=1 Tax=Friedmanniomyces simplex TaxID=329884 RepID=A0A4U0XCI0_9PEZI|nr:hypothetical protein B0A55_07779 [Friedmanniomyces simplex]
MRDDTPSTARPSPPHDPASSDDDEPSDIEDSATTASSDESEQDPKSTRWRVQDIIFAFGPEQSYFISAALGQWRFHGKLSTRFNATDIKQPAAVALTPEGGYVFVYETADGKASVVFSEAEEMIPSSRAAAWVEVHAQYRRLCGFLRESSDYDVRRLEFFSIGPNASWFARRGEEVAFHNLPDALENAVTDKQAQGTHPQQVALGMHDSYVVLWSDGSHAWSLAGYETLKSQLKQDGRLNTVVISATDCHQWFLVRESGMVEWHLTQLPRTEINEIARLARAFMQRTARRWGTRFEMKASVSGSEEDRMQDLEKAEEPPRDDPPQDEYDMVYLPYRTLTAQARMGEYLNETPSGLQPVKSNKSGKDEEYELVTFKDNDVDNPKNWSKKYKWWCTMCVAITCFSVAFNSAVITADLAGVSKTFDVSFEVSLLTVTLFVVGFGIGPMVFAPLSEIVGRRMIYATTLLVALIFIIPCAVSQNIGTLLVCRFIDGIAFSAPMTLVGGTLADLWRNEERGVPMAAFSAAPFVGPAIGPLIGGFLSDALGWRWLYWIQLILAGACYILITFTVPETYAPTILARRAKKMRKELNDSKYVTEQDLDMRPLSERLRVFLLRPFQILFMEPIVLFLAIYMSVLYGLLYMFFVAFPIIYQEGKGYSAGTTGVMFIPVAVGVLLSAACAPFVNKHYTSIVHKHNGKPPAEARLIPMMWSCWLIPIGLFIFAWTSYPRLHWAGPALGGLPIGFGFIFLYNSANNYLVDSYQHQAASALAAKTFLRSFWGASTVLFTTQMYHTLGYQWAGSLLAFISLACCAIPFVFYHFGAEIRKRSHFAYNGDEEKNTKGPQ